ncbi:hypothetical protein TIFTF001_017772 [Ficus carica]|uniref:Uncharacterized protein n=1 Tax=Ficus carica TaxID=3494 RepID=A0AA88DB26_FICCA|nr:hypothetical protein TIFTF001_017772 [Ficus carica]
MDGMAVGALLGRTRLTGYTTQKRSRGEIVWTRHNQLHVVRDLEFFSERRQICSGDCWEEVVYRVDGKVTFSLRHFPVGHPVDENPVHVHCSAARVLTGLNGFPRWIGALRAPRSLSDRNAGLAGSPICRRVPVCGRIDHLSRLAFPYLAGQGVRPCGGRNVRHPRQVIGCPGGLCHHFSGQFRAQTRARARAEGNLNVPGQAVVFGVKNVTHIEEKGGGGGGMGFYLLGSTLIRSGEENSLSSPRQLSAGRNDQQFPDDENVQPSNEHDHFHISSTQSIPGPFSDDMATRPDFTTSSRYATFPGWVVLGDDLASPNTPPRGIMLMTGRGPHLLRSTYYLASDLSHVTVHLNSRLPPPAPTRAAPVNTGGRPF